MSTSVSIFLGSIISRLFTTTIDVHRDSYYRNEVCSRDSNTVLDRRRLLSLHHKASLLPHASYLLLYACTKPNQTIYILVIGCLPVEIRNYYLMEMGVIYQSA